MRTTIPLLFALVLLPTGCSCQKPTYPVKGKVVYKEDGKPVAGGVVIWFESTTPPYERAQAAVDKDGNFVLSTVREGSGAIQGEHRIRFDPPPVMDGTAASALARIMHPRYNEFATSGLK